MTPSPRPWWRSLAVAGAGAAALGAVLVDLVVPRLGGAPPDLVLFFGRFHPLAVHLPVGILILVAAAEVLTLHPALRRRIDPALGVVLPFMVVAAVGSFLLGHLLALGAGYPAGTLLLHRRLMFAVVLVASGCLVAWTWHDRRPSGLSRGLYRAALGASFGLLAVGAHFGGVMTRGETYLSKYAPGLLRSLLGGEEPRPEERPDEPPRASAEPLVYADVVAPLLEAHCVECHGPETAKGHLRVDGVDALLAGGGTGPAIVAGAGARSLIVARMTLPASDDDHMPPKGRPGPTAEEIATISFWIDRGATLELRVRDALVPDGARAVLARAAERRADGGAEARAEREPAGPAASASAEPAGSGSADEAASAVPSDKSRAADPSVDDFDDVEPVRPPPGPAPTTPTATGAGALAFEALVGPILIDRCGRCHGEAKQKGKLRLDGREAVMKGGASGPVVVAGDPAASPLVQRLKLPPDDEDHMPPKREAQPDATEIAVLEAWIQKGAGAELRASALGLAKAPPRPSAAPRPAPTAPAPAPSATSAAPSAATATPEPPPPPHPPAHLPASPPADATLLAKLPARVHLWQVVEPLLADRCASCHSGSDASGQLSVDDEPSLRAGGASGSPVVPGKPLESPLVARLLLPLYDGDHMPPGVVEQLTPGEIELIALWVEHGSAADGTIATRAMSRGAAEALLASPALPAALAASPPAPVEAAGPAPLASGRVPEAPHVQGGGCAACALGRTHGAPVTALAALGALALGWALRRARRRRRPHA
ncbi:MAG: hypothetical protein IT373_01820 [Polyangiaceae bacterium]|nr:hypothetical protein [Polyangiaceae bacterium]